MKLDLKRYLAGSGSGAWFGPIPSHWSARPSFGAFTPLSVRNRGLVEKTVLSLSYGRIVVRPPERLTGLVPESFEGYQIVEAGDIVVRTTDLQNDHTSLRIGAVRERGIITSAYLALRAKNGIDPDYAFLVLTVWDSSKAIYGFGSGLRQGLAFEHFKRMPIPVPPVEEQEAIVRFLDWANGRLERVIRGKRKVIALLTEQKQAIIHRSVTRGLDPTVPLKPSGIPWLGDIPAHWETLRLKNVTTHIVDCLHATPKYLPDGVYPAIRTADITPGLVNVERAKKVGAADFAKWTERLVPEEGDIVYSREGERFGIAAPVPAHTDLCISQRMMIFRVSPGHDSEFIMWALNADPTYRQATQDVMGSTSPHVNISTIRNFALALPSASEQRQICDSMAALLQPIEKSLQKLKQELLLFAEYRTRLSADVVTGKLDAREASKNLPVEFGDDLVDESAGDDELEIDDEEAVV